MPDKDYTIELEVRNQPGVLVRIAHVFARRGCNIRSLHVEPHDDEQWSTMTIVVRNVSHISQIVSQLQKLVDVSRATARDPIPQAGTN